MNSLAMAFQQQGLLSQADAKYAQALQLSEKYPEHDLAAKVSNNLAMLRGTQGRFAEAEVLYLRALVIQKQLYGDRNAAVAITLDNLAMLQLNLRRYAEAEKNLLHALELSRESANPKHPKTLTKMNNLAYSTRLGRYQDAERLYKKVLATRERMLGREDLESHTLNNLGDLFRLQGGYQSAEPLYRRALLINEKVLGTDSLRNAPILNNLAIVARNKGRLAEAEDFYLRAIAINEQSLGPDHASLGMPLINLAELYVQLQRYTDAERFYRRALPFSKRPRSIMLKCFALLSMAEGYRVQRRYDKLSHSSKGNRHDREDLGPDHPGCQNSPAMRCCFERRSGRLKRQIEQRAVNRGNRGRKPPLGDRRLWRSARFRTAEPGTDNLEISIRSLVLFGNDEWRTVKLPRTGERRRGRLNRPVTTATFSTPNAAELCPQ
jgi:tetratricopeptide (TPR) repeat protein